MTETVFAAMQLPCSAWPGHPAETPAVRVRTHVDVKAPFAAGDDVLVIHADHTPRVERLVALIDRVPIGDAAEYVTQIWSTVPADPRHVWLHPGPTMTRTEGRFALLTSWQDAGSFVMDHGDVMSDDDHAWRYVDSLSRDAAPLPGFVAWLSDFDGTRDQLHAALQAAYDPAAR